jgi:hypothetical protein
MVVDLLDEPNRTRRLQLADPIDARELSRIGVRREPLGVLCLAAEQQQLAGRMVCHLVA